MTKLQRQDSSIVTVQIAQTKAEYPRPWCAAELVQADLDALGPPTIDRQDPVTAGKLWIRVVENAAIRSSTFT